MNRFHSFLIALLSMLSFSSANAQNLNWDWAETGGGMSKSAGNTICTDKQGNIYVAGSFQKAITLGSVTLNAQDTTNYTIFIAKYNAYHEVLWAYGGQQSGQATAISVSNDGSVYVTGWYSGIAIFGSSTFVSNNGSSGFVLKLNSAGNQLWVKNVCAQPGAYDGYQFGRAIINDSLGNVYVAGDFSCNTLMIGGTVVQNPNVGCFGDIWFARFSSTGGLNWVKRMGGYGKDEPRALSIDQSGNIYLTGNSTSTTMRVFDTITRPASDERFFTAKFSPSGSIYWLRLAGNTYADDVRSICNDIEGNTYITGTAWLTGMQDFGNGVSIPARGYKDQFFVKYDNNGNTVWAKSIGGTNEDVGTGLCVDHWGNICVSGYSTSPEWLLDNDTISITGMMLHVARFQPDGTLSALHTANSSSYCAFLQPTGMVSDIYGNIYTTGAFNSDSAQFDNILLTKNHECSSEYFLAELGNPHSQLSLANESMDNILLYPNPVSNQFHLSLNENAAIEIVSITGQIVMKFNLEMNASTIDVSDLQNGLYLLRMTTSKGILVKEFIKER